MDNQTLKACYAFAPHQNVLDEGRYRGLTNAMAMPKPVVANINNWAFYSEHEAATPEQEAYMRELCV